MTDRPLLSPRLAALHALRAQLDAIIIAEESVLAAVEAQEATAAAQSAAGSCPHCGAGEDLLVDASTAGGGPPRRHCLRCDQTSVAPGRLTL